jgi:hypothetical protein
MIRILLMLLLLPLTLSAQRNRAEEGFELGIFRLRPVAEASVSYDDRVVITGNDADGDLYSEAEAALYMENTPAQYDLSADAGYGYRFYNEYNGLDNDFYQAGVAVSSEANPLKLGFSSYLKKTLDYDTLYGDQAGDIPGAILTRDPSTRYTALANIAYERNLTGKTSIEPGYDYWYYFQDFTDREDAEWQVHRASLRAGYAYTEKTRIFLTGYYSLQVNEEEDGTIGAATLGAQGSFSDKTTWLAHIGVAAADYELSGTDEGVVGLLRLNWDITEKAATYIYGSSNFQPGYSGGDARRVQRLAYGASWRIVSRWSARFQVLHDYQEELNATDDGEFKNFLSVRTDYDLTNRLAMNAGVRYTRDDEVTDQTVVSLGIGYRY